ncbi:MAG: thiamine biosynthesis lipoprotein [Paraglaciecola sp.]|jgi:thiamine biosynthesis lipoprotein
MGTNIHVVLWSDSVQQGGDAIQAVMGEMQRINQLMSPYIETSDLSELNNHACDTSIIVSKKLFELIALSVELVKEISIARTLRLDAL